MKKRIIISSIFIIMTGLIFGNLAFFQYNSYQKNYNERLNALFCYIQTKAPEITGAEIMQIMNSDELAKENAFERYGIDLEKDPVIMNNQESFEKWLILDLIICLVWSSIVVAYFIVRERHETKKVRAVARYIEQINKGDYSYDVEAIEEGELSKLESELYKTTIMLRESAENSQRDKQNLRDSLSDISHQLKTPLTSMVINLDNLGELSDNEGEKKRILVRNAKRDAKRMTEMVAKLLTLSRLDASVVTFSKKEVKMSEFVVEAIADVESLADLKGIELTVLNPEEGGVVLKCDPYWQAQALANILKNGIEHAKTMVNITYFDGQLYRELIIENDGEPISEIDRKNIFQRFYHGESAGRESVGIGLSLANAIVKQDGGYIIVESDETKPGSGAKFIIRYV